MRPTAIASRSIGRFSKDQGSAGSIRGGAVALIGGLIARSAKMDLVDFARDALFAPLGITQLDWWRGRDRIPAAASGLRLTTRDLLRVGAVLLDGGRWQGH
jgi:CubicO group peptidase (beta-lactamase class C family)